MISLKHKILGRALSLTAAAVLSCTAVSGSGSLRCAAEPAVQALQQEKETTVPVIVRVAGEAVMEQPAAEGMGADYLDTVEAAAQSGRCLDVQQRVEARIRALYPALTVGFRYTTLCNGFSCDLPAALLGQIRALPEVVSVTEAAELQLPQSESDAEAGGFPVASGLSGCTGEGQVIAVIDSELDTTHPMFTPLADDIETALSYEDVAEIVSSGTLHVNVDPERAYLSSKLPYVIDYLDDDRYGGVSDALAYHGTHVSGIAAGNEFEASDGTVLSGIAKDAQLMFFACGKGKTMSFSAALAGLEDAVKLHADVINMSWGTEAEYYGENPFTEAIAAADRAGIVVCNSAGNSNNSARAAGNAATPDMPDTGSICDKAELGSPLLVVASGENSGMAEAGMFLFQGQTIVYRPTMSSQGSTSFLSQELPPGEYTYTDCGEGTDEAIRTAEPVNQLILIRRAAGQNLAEIAQKAQSAQALGIILIDSEIPDGLDCVFCDEKLKFAVVTFEEGMQMLEAERKTVTFTGENVMQDYPARVSSYSSWGVKHSLDLRPDITGIGGRVRSAAYVSSDRTLSGTSMASSYVAGCAAVLRAYLKQKGELPEGAALSSYIRRLLMNTAVPYEENGLLVTPRRQGAGLVSPERAASARVLMTGPDGEAKVNLFDQLECSFSFDAELTNFSDTDVVFQDASLRLTTDGLRYDSSRGCNILSGQQALICSTNLSGPVTVAAGAAETLNVQVKLDAAQCASLSAAFTNGFFVEGYLMLSGAENSADISMPVLGFYGDWTQVPIGDQEQVMAATIFGDNYRADGVSLVENQTILSRLRTRVPADIPKYQILNLRDYAEPEEIRLLDCGRNEAWISPNEDGIADAVYGMKLISYRKARANLELKDAKGRVRYQQKNVPFRDVFELDFDQSSLEEGDYTLTASAYIDYPLSELKSQDFSTVIHVDKTAPEASVSFSRQGDREVLTITASDDRQLQGITVTGTGFGCLADRYSPDMLKLTVQEDCWYYGGRQFGGVYPWYSGTENDATRKLPFILREMAGYLLAHEGERINFRDYLAPEPSDDGTWTVEYDVTDLKDYSFTVLDRAYNYTEINTVDDSAEQFVQKQNIYLDSLHGAYKVNQNVIIFTDFFDGSDTMYSYQAENNRLTLRTSEESRYFIVNQLDGGFIYELTDLTSGEVSRLTFLADKYSYSQTKFYPINDLMKAAAENSAALCGKEPVRTELDYVCIPDMITVSVYFEYEEDGKRVEICDHYEQIEIPTGRGLAIMKKQTVSESGTDFVRGDVRRINLFQQLETEIPPGLYALSEHNCAFLFNPDGETGTILYNSVYGNAIGCSEDSPFTYTIGADSIITLNWEEHTISGLLSSDGTGRKFWIERNQEAAESKLWEYTDTLGTLEFQLVSDDQEALRQLLPTDELIALGMGYAAAVFNAEPTEMSFMGFGYEHCCLMDFECGGLYVSLVIDPLTLTVWDDFGEQGDLLKPPQLPEGSYSMETIRCMAENDFLFTNAIVPDSSGMRLLSNGSVLVILYEDKLHEEIGSYIVDPVTGKGVNIQGDEVDLPQTGNNDPSALVLTVLAVLMLAAGICCCLVRVRRRMDEE